jgi:predicted RNA-binding protein
VVVFTREVRARASAQPAVRELREELQRQSSPEVRGRLEAALREATLAVQSELAAEFDAVHSVERALAVGSLREIVEPAALRPFVVRALRRQLSSGALHGHAAE